MAFCFLLMITVIQPNLCIFFHSAQKATSSHLKSVKKRGQKITLWYILGGLGCHCPTGADSSLLKYIFTKLYVRRDTTANTESKSHLNRRKT
jgi:hypothetical protein